MLGLSAVGSDLMRKSGASTFIAVMLLAGCGPTEDRSSNADASVRATEPEFARQLLPAEELPADAQEARYQACSAAYSRWINAGVWQHGGARPGVDRDAWEELGDDERQEIIDAAACLATGGQVEAVTVEILEAGTQTVIAEEESENRAIYLQPTP
jgi:hypothetical protein